MKKLFEIIFVMFLVGCCTDSSTTGENRGLGQNVRPSPVGPSYRHPDEAVIPAPPIPN